MKRASRETGISLVEILVAVAIIAILVSLIGVNWQKLRTSTERSTATNNMRSIGISLRLYAADNDQYLPRRSIGEDAKWPHLLSDYLDDVKVYAGIGDPNNYLVRDVDPLSDARNNTSYILNGFNDAGAYSDPSVQVRLTSITEPGKVIMLGIPISGSRHYYMDVLEGMGNHHDVLDLTRYEGGSNYLFADGSVRYYRKDDYDPRWWLVNQEFELP